MRTALGLGACSIGVLSTVGFDDFPPTVATVDRAMAGAVLLVGATSLIFHHMMTTYLSDIVLRMPTPERESLVSRAGLTAK